MSPEQIKNINLAFIVSTGRTGSTLLATMCNMHPHMLAASEETFAFSLYEKYKPVKVWTKEVIQQYCYDFYLFSEGKLEPQFGTILDLEEVLLKHQETLTISLAIRLTYLCFCPEKDKSDIRVILDKELVLHPVLDKLAENYPGSKFIILLRDPRDNVLVKLNLAKRVSHLVGDPITYALVWNYVYSKIGKMRNKIGAHRFLELKYEDLMADPERELQRMCAFVGVSYDPRMLGYTEVMKERFESEEVNESIRKNLEVMHSGLIEKVSTKKVGKWKTELTKEQQDQVWRLCGTTALQFGYTADGCDPKAKLPLSFAGILSRVLMKRYVAAFYYLAPAFVRTFIKQMKYGRRFRTGTWATDDFYQKNAEKLKKS